MPSRALYHSRRHAGRCGSCGVNSPRPGRHTCADCAATIAQANSAREAERRARGVCVQCGKAPAVSAQVRCAACAQKQAARMRGPAPQV